MTVGLVVLCFRLALRRKPSAAYQRRTSDCGLDNEHSRQACLLSPEMCIYVYIYISLSLSLSLCMLVTVSYLLHVNPVGAGKAANNSRSFAPGASTGLNGRPPFSTVSDEQAEQLFQAAFSGRGVDQMLDEELARFNIKPGQNRITTHHFGRFSTPELKPRLPARSSCSSGQRRNLRAATPCRSSCLPAARSRRSRADPRRERK